MSTGLILLRSGLGKTVRASPTGTSCPLDCFGRLSWESLCSTETSPFSWATMGLSGGPQPLVLSAVRNGDKAPCTTVGCNMCSKHIKDTEGSAKQGSAK